jgi:hypothetical protein
LSAADEFDIAKKFDGKMDEVVDGHEFDLLQISIKKRTMFFTLLLNLKSYASIGVR